MRINLYNKTPGTSIQPCQQNAQNRINPKSVFSQVTQAAMSSIPRISFRERKATSSATALDRKSLYLSADTYTTRIHIYIRRHARVYNVYAGTAKRAVGNEPGGDFFPRQAGGREELIAPFCRDAAGGELTRGADGREARTRG